MEPTEQKHKKQKVLRTERNTETKQTITKKKMVKTVKTPNNMKTPE